MKDLKVLISKKALALYLALAVLLMTAFGGDTGKEYACKAASFLNVTVEDCPQAE